MDKKGIFKSLAIAIPIASVIASTIIMPIHTAIKILMVVYIPVMFILDLSFFIAPFAICVFLIWILYIIKQLFNKKLKTTLKKTWLIPSVSLLIIILAYFSILSTDFFLDVGLPTLGVDMEGY